MPAYEPIIHRKECKNGQYTAYFDSSGYIDTKAPGPMDAEPHLESVVCVECGDTIRNTALVDMILARQDQGQNQSIAETEDSDDIRASGERSSV